MVKISEKLQVALDEDRTVFSFEYFPPKTDAGVANLVDRVDRMARELPLFVDITWGAGGSTSQLSLELALTFMQYCNVDTMMHLTCTNMPVDTLRETLDKCRDKGLRNILALRGDPPHGQSEWTAHDSGFEHAVDLVRFIRAEYGDHFCIAVAGYPEGHAESPSPEEDMAHLREKVDAGADFIVTQLFYDCDMYLNWVKRCGEAGIKVPIVPGIMPVQSYAGWKRMTTLCKTTVPPNISERLESIKDDDAEVKAYGVELAVDMCRKLRTGGVRAFHFYTLNLETTVSKILAQLEWSPPPPAMPWRAPVEEDRAGEDVRPIYWSNRRHAYLARTRDWDNFPNGRWGDARSAAFGELPEYLSRLRNNEPDTRRGMWGEAPTTPVDVANVFVGYVRGDVARTPWNEEPLRPETDALTAFLERLNRAGFLSINSQPVANGVSSADSKIGWGGPGGRLYQKAYLEMFVPPEWVDRLRALLDAAPEITYQMANAAGESHSNTTGTSAVTWGVWPCREILQPTVVDQASFSAWRSEAFNLWTSWATLYDQGTPSRSLIERVRDTYWLVNIVDHNYVDGGDMSALLEPVVREAEAAATSKQ